MNGICFLHMPIVTPTHPSMALSILAAECRQQNIKTNVIYGSLRFAAHCTPKNYLSMANLLHYFTFAGEMLFKQYAGFPDTYSAKDYFNYAEKYLPQTDAALKIMSDFKEAFQKLESYVESYLDELCDIVIATGCKAVGCEITYEQRNASLAILKRIKERNPQIITMLGGNSCTGDHGQAIADNVDFVDLVFSGEADDIIAPVVKLIEQGKTAKEINNIYPSVLIKGSNTYSHGRKNLEDNVIPDFSDYFNELKITGLDKYVVPCLLIEGSRGCWWGEKSRCKFCGIHTCKETLAYRKKSAEKIVHELNTQAERYNTNIFVFTDCILSPEHIRQIPQLIDTNNNDFHLFAEIKSNISKNDLIQLKKAGFIKLQPGIESLEDNLLKLMNKGNRAIKHIELLKNAKILGINIVWNMLYSMPFEKEEYYKQMISLLPWITHLQPPVSFNAIIYQLNSCYTQDAEHYGLKLKPLEIYPFLGSYEGSFYTKSIEYFYDTSNSFVYIPSFRETLNTLSCQIEHWKTVFKDGAGDRLTMYDKDGILEIFDLRTAAQKSFYTLQGRNREIMLALENVTCEKNLLKLLPYTVSELETGLEELAAQHLIIRINGEALALPTSSESQPYTYEPALATGHIKMGADNDE